MDIRDWLRKLGLERYEQAFRDNDVDEDILPSLTVDDLTAMGVHAIGHRRKLLNAIATLGLEAKLKVIQEKDIASEASSSPLTKQIAERRQLTIVFCDLVGSTELSERIDPEDLRRVILTYHGVCSNIITRFSGHIAKYLGDGILAYFGWPQTHEDDAERAVRASLEMVEAVAKLKPMPDIALSVRIGIASGLVVVGDLLGKGASFEETVIGETPNIAARIQSLAEPAGILIDPNTRRLLGGLFALEDLGERRIKGLKRRVQLWSVLGESQDRTRFEALRGRLRTPLIDREHDLAILTAACRSAEEGHGQIVASVGEAGVGKSRLLGSFIEASMPAHWRIHRSGCVSYGTSTSWLPIVELAKSCLGIMDRDTRSETSAKIERLDEHEKTLADHAVAPLHALLGIAVEDRDWANLNPPQRRRRIIDAVRELLLVHSDETPVCIVIEDLHWADADSLTFLDSLVDSLPTRRVLMLVNYRPEFQHEWSTRSYYRQLQITPLDQEGVQQLLETLVGPRARYAQLESRLIEQAEGNPLFVEEAVRDLVEAGSLVGERGHYEFVAGSGDISLPKTIQAILAARIDRLSQDAKYVLQRTAVIGQNIPLPILANVVDIPEDELQARLGELRAAEMLYETKFGPEAHFVFKHALTHEVAYSSMLRELRRELHRRVGEAIETLYPERLVELSESLAGHFSRGEEWSKAARYALNSAEKAKSRYAYRAGIVFAEQARDAASKLDDLAKEWILANVLLGDLASLTDDIELANTSYDQALLKAENADERHWIANKRHEKHFAIRDGAKIAYYVHGSGKETILFMSQIGHGIGSWQPVVERLCQKFRIITIDPRGTGSSAPVVSPFLAKDHGLDVAAVVRDAASEPVTAVGISRGGISVVHAAAKVSRLFKRLVLVGTPTGLPNSLSPQLIENERRAAAEGDFERVARLFIPTTISEPGTEDLIEQRVKAYLSLPTETILNFYESRAAEFNVFIPTLQKIKLPVLVMHGTADKRVSFRDGLYIAKAVEGAQLYPFEGRGHLCQVTATQEFCEVLERFATTGSVVSADQVDANSLGFGPP